MSDAVDMGVGARRDPASGTGPRVVAIGGGHGLAATLGALRGITDRLTAVVGMADDGGSSGRLRKDLGVPPPGDLRMALAALCGDDAWARTWRSVLQHRFGEGELRGHAVGNLLISALWEQTGDLVEGLEWVGALLGAQGRVLPVTTVGLQIVAEIRDASGAPPRLIRGQSRVTAAEGEVLRMALEPADPVACPQAVAAIDEADALIMGPGSWYTSVLASLLVPGIRAAFSRARAKRILVLNLVAQPGETSGFSPQGHIEVLARAFPEIRFDVVLADRAYVPDDAELARASDSIGAQLVLRRVSDSLHGPGHHDRGLLGRALADLIGDGAVPSWR